MAGARDRVVILLGYALGLRASDLVGLGVGDLTAIGEGLDVYVARSKTDQDAQRGARCAQCTPGWRCLV